MKKILLLEDDKSLSIGIVYYLNKKGYHIVHCENLKESYQKVSSEKFDLAILDVTLQDGESYDFGKFLKKELNVPVVFLTAKDEEKDILKGFEVGAEDYITKPFYLNVLNARIELILERNKEKNLNFRYSGDIKIDIFAAKVYINNKIVDLTQTEYKLLNYFMDNYNIVLTREKILEFLWDSDADFESYSTISVYVNRLREKIKDTISPSKYISTKRGMGYMWIMEVK